MHGGHSRVSQTCSLVVIESVPLVLFLIIGGSKAEDPPVHFFTVSNEVAKVMFLQVCVCPQGTGVLGPGGSALGA